jgi:hypothetical protein
MKKFKKTMNNQAQCPTTTTKSSIAVATRTQFCKHARRRSRKEKKIINTAEKKDLRIENNMNE